MSFLITGATGNVGSYILEKSTLKETIAGISSERSRANIPLAQDYRIIRFGDETTYKDALQDIDYVFLMRPPHISNIKRDILPFLKAVKERGVQHIIFLSLAGAEKNKFVPHHKIEKYITDLELNHTFLRPTFFMQNLSTTHLDEIKAKHEIIVPAGKGKTNFIDVRDIAEAAVAVVGKREHINKAYTITGAESYTYDEIAEIMSRELNKPIAYNNPSAIRFFKEMRRKGHPMKYIFVMIGIYWTTKFGLADIRTSDLEKIIGRKPIPFSEFVRDHAELFS